MKELSEGWDLQGKQLTRSTTSMENGYNNDDDDNLT